MWMKPTNHWRDCCAMTRWTTQFAEPPFTRSRTIGLLRRLRCSRNLLVPTDRWLRKPALHSRRLPPRSNRARLRCGATDADLFQRFKISQRQFNTPKFGIVIVADIESDVQMIAWQ